MSRSAVTILGAGFAGTALAAHLARLPGQFDADIHLVEPRPVPGPGLAYSADRPEYLLNVRARALSLLANEPGHFVAWLQETGESAGPSDFCPRQLYGRYLHHCLQHLLAAPAPNGLRFHWHATSAVAMHPPANGAATVALASGATLATDTVVLALGNFPPLPPTPLADYAAHPGFHANPWAPGCLARIPRHEAVVLIGSGLTAVDVLLGLRAQNHAGPISVVSGHGRWPGTHAPEGPAYPAYYETRLRGLRTVAAVLRAVRAEVQQAAAAGLAWQPVVDALRPDLGLIWEAWPLSEQQRFLRHLASLWTTIRHRSPPQNAETIARLEQQGQVKRYQGRVTTIDPDADHLHVRARHGTQRFTLSARHVVACTGPLLDYTRMQAPLIQQLRNNGLIVPDPLRLGLLTDANGALRQADGTTATALFTLGASRRPASFESTAVPELRQQAAALATHLASALTPTGPLPG